MEDSLKLLYSRFFQSNAALKIQGISLLLGIGFFLSACREQENTETVTQRSQQRATQQTSLPGKIVFQSDRDGDWEIFVMNSDGSHLTQLTDNAAYDGYPVWSPNGKEIAFESDRDGNSEIYIMHADGSNQRRVTNHPANEASPAWSPDGTRLAFDSDRASVREIYLIDADGSQEEQWTKTAGKNALPAWSPDGKRLAYTGNRYLGWNVYAMTLDKEDDRRLTDGHGACRPDWSPDGREIAYVSHKSDKKGDIWVMNPDGSEPRQLTFDSEHADYYPAWSPDGQYIAYAKNEIREKQDNWELYVIGRDGSLPVKLTNHPANDTFPDWAEGHLTK